MSPAKATALPILVLLAWAAVAHAETPGGRQTSSKIDYFYRLLPPDAPQSVGQEALGAIQEAVGLLLADPATEWSEVSIARLRQRLVDLDAVLLRARVEEAAIEGGLEITVEGDSATLSAARRIVPAHMAAVEGFRAWSVELIDSPPSGPLRLRLLSPDQNEVEVLRALGFFGFLASGVYFPGYHLALARGTL